MDDLAANHLVYQGTRREETRESVSGVEFDDPYQWLERDTPETLAWDDAENRLTAGYLQAWPGYAIVRRKLEQLRVPWLSITLDGSLQGPVACGDRWVRLVPSPGNLASIVISDEPLGDGEAIHDPAMVPAHEAYVHTYHPSPDGRYVALKLAPAYDIDDPMTWNRGATQSADAVATGLVAIGVYDVAARKMLPGRSTVPTFVAPVWNHDSTGYWVIAVGQTADGTEGAGVVFRAVDDEGPSVVQQPGFGILTASSEDDKVLLAMEGPVGRGGVFINTDGVWRRLLPECPPRFQGRFVGDRFVTRWFGDASNGRIVSLPLEDAEDLATWREVVAEQEKPAQWMNVVQGRIVVGYQDDTDVEMRLFDLEGRPQGTVPLRGGMIPRSYAGHGDGIDSAPGGFSFLYDGFTIAPEFHIYRFADGEVETHRFPGADLGPLEHVRLEATAEDGTIIPFHVLRRPSTDLSCPRPVILSAYGNLGLVRTDPPTLYLPFLDAGGVYVWANIRGGGEFGLDWHAAGKGLNKGRPSKDLVAVAESIIERGISAPRRIGITYNSGGGILTAIALTRRPDLWGAAVPVGGLTDFLRHWSVFPHPDWPEPSTPEIAQSNREWSPQQNVREGDPFPPTLLVAFEPELGWTGQYRKFAATVRSASSSDAPILYRRVHSYWHWDFSPQDGHNGPDSGEVQIDRLAFLMRSLGVDPIDD